MTKRRKAAAKAAPRPPKAGPRSAKPRRRRASPDRLRERQTQRGYNEMTYSQPDLSSLGRGDTKTGYPSDAPARQVAKDPSWRGGQWTDNPNVPLRQQAAGGPRPGTDSGRSRRRLSTESALRRADASMFNYDD